LTDNEVVELLNFDKSLGHIPFLENGYIINIDNSSLKNPVKCSSFSELEQRQWHLYIIENHEVVEVISLSDNGLKSLIEFIVGLLRG
jgi:hypothetical protein